MATKARLREIASEMQRMMIDVAEVEDDVSVCKFISDQYGLELNLTQARTLREHYEDGPRNQVMISGKRPAGSIRLIEARLAVGKKVVAVAESVTTGDNGDEPCTLLFFSDSTMCMFVHPSDGE